MNEGFRTFIAASARDRIDTFLSAAQRLGANAQYAKRIFGSLVPWTSYTTGFSRWDLLAASHLIFPP